MVRGMERTRLFRTDRDRVEFLRRVGSLVERTGTRILAWTLMDNHVHLLLVSGQQGIPAFMRSLLTGYAIWYNRTYGRHGHLFQNRYKSILCEEDAYLLELVRYIHLNPYRAHIVRNVEDLERYPWSGHGALVGRAVRQWQETEYILSQFSDDRRRAQRAYRAFVHEGSTQGKRADLVGGGLVRSLGGWSQVRTLKEKKTDHDTRILGSSQFVAHILREADKKLRRQLRMDTRGEQADALIQSVCAAEGIDEKELRAGGQRRRISDVRAHLCYQLSRELALSLAETGRYLGVTTSAVFKAISSFEQKKEK
ncbi:MAG: transposase [Deltaproteobacteria bacterium]|jgi:REP element-mobilizing transposase RayT|nr:transposase [Deltaproteobacteria bacterium]